jgi:indole-3-glycerol phosphate synthase
MNLLDRILAAKREELEVAMSRAPLADIVARAWDAAPTRGFLVALESGSRYRRDRGDAFPVSLIAEVKKASPAKGLIRADFDPGEIARAYRDAGADCLSVLTDAPFFQGSAENLLVAREVSGLPVLRKDFTTDAYHLYEARAMGADAVLLIVHGLSRGQIQEYREIAESLGMDALVEAHTLEEAELAISTGAQLVGINNRNLETFETQIAVSERTIPAIADRAFVVSESALHSRDDVERVQRSGAGAVLIGTAFCKSTDIGAKVREVMGW